jgi:hypothetical protein
VRKKWNFHQAQNCFQTNGSVSRAAVQASRTDVVAAKTKGVERRVVPEGLGQVLDAHIANAVAAEAERLQRAAVICNSLMCEALKR